MVVFIRNEVRIAYFLHCFTSFVLQHAFMGVGRIFLGGSKVVKFVFLPLEIEKTIFLLRFSKSRGARPLSDAHACVVMTDSRALCSVCLGLNKSSRSVTSWC